MQKGQEHLDGCPYINHESLKAKGFTEEALAKIEKAFRLYSNLSFAFNKFTLGVDFLTKKSRI